MSPTPRPSARRRVAGERSRPVLRPSEVTAEPTVEGPLEPVVAPVVQPGRQTPDASGPEGARTSGDDLAETPAAPQPNGGRGLPGWVLPVLAGLLVVVCVAVLVLLRADQRARQVDQASGEAVSAARTAATKILSYDYRHLDADFAAGKALTAAPFSAQYTRTTSQAVRQVATDTKATVVAEVAAAGVEQASARRVVVVLFVNQTTTSSRLQRPQVDQNRVEMTMVERDGRWLVSQVAGL